MDGGDGQCQLPMRVLEKVNGNLFLVIKESLYAVLLIKDGDFNLLSYLIVFHCCLLRISIDSLL